MAPLDLVLRATAYLPWPVLHLLADFIGFVACRVVRYRVGVVRANLAMCFPSMTIKERNRTAWLFYRHLADYFVETVRYAYRGQAGIKGRIEYVGTEQVAEILNGGRDIVAYTSHFGNWEWVTTLGLHCPGHEKYIFGQVYRPLKQPWFDRWFFRLRSRYSLSIPMREAFRRLLEWRRGGSRWIVGFLSDQKPSRDGRSIEVPFMGIPTPFIEGTELLACKLDAAVIYMSARVTGRSRYRITLRMLSEWPRAERPGEITRRYTAWLEQDIKRYPPAYLWSHNRWRIKKTQLTR